MTGVPVLQAAALADASVTFVWSDGLEASFASLWLLDNAPSARASAVGQRLHPALSLATAGSLLGADVAGDAVWLRFETDSVEWPGASLRARALRESQSGISLWQRGDEIAARPALPYPSYLTDDAALRSALEEVADFGLVRLTGAGSEPDEIERAVARFGFIRETNYGRLFEVRVLAEPDNLAFTARALEPHTDNPYREPVPTLQILHGVRNAGDGGATTFLDGFALAEGLRASHPRDFDRLAAHAVPFAYTDSAGHRYEARTPVIRLTADGAVTGIRFNHRSLGAVPFGAEEAALWYVSYVRFAQAAAEHDRQHAILLAPGEIVIFDNERILHGREAFSGAVDRLLMGCYADRDGLRATLARLRDVRSAAYPDEQRRRSVR